MRVYLAGMDGWWSETRRYMDLLKPVFENRNHFVNFNRPQYSEQFARAIPSKMRVVDSGAYFYIAKHRAQQVENIGMDADSFVKKYILWIQETWNLFDYFIEFDIQELVPYSNVLRWREWFRKANVSTKMIHAIHKGNTLDEFKRMVDESESRYVAISFLPTKKAHLPYTNLVRYCWDQSCRVHGFQMTKPRHMLEVPFYSVDSTTWSDPLRYGSTLWWDEQEARLINVVTTSSEWKKPEKAKKFARLGIPVRWAETFTMETKLEKVIAAVQAFGKFEKHVTDVWKGRGIDWAKRVGEEDA